MADKRILLQNKLDSIRNKDSLLDRYNVLSDFIISMYQYDCSSFSSFICSPYHIHHNLDMDIDKLPSRVQKHVYSLIHQNDFIFILVDKLLNKEPVAFSMYKAFYKDNREMILQEVDVLGNDDLYNQYMGTGADYEYLMVMNANHWLQHADINFAM